MQQQQRKGGREASGQGMDGSGEKGENYEGGGGGGGGGVGYTAVGVLLLFLPPHRTEPHRTNIDFSPPLSLSLSLSS